MTGDLLTLALAAKPAAPAAVHHYMGVTACAGLLFLTLAADFMCFLPTWLRDRVIVTAGTAAIYEGFNGSWLDKWTVGLLTGTIQKGLDSTGNARIAGASATFLAGLLLALVFIYCLGCFMPAKFQKVLGQFATMKFPNAGLFKLNGKVWALAAALGILSDLPTGPLGQFTMWGVDTVTGFWAPIIGYLTGGA